MKYLLLITYFIFGLSFHSNAQLKDLIKNKVNKLKKKAKSEGSEEVGKQGLKLDTASFSYAISMTDNAAFVGQNQSKAKSLGLTALKSGKLFHKRSRAEKAMDMNRQGESFYQARQYKLAGLKFLTALLVYTDDAELDDAAFDNPLEILKNKDTQTKLLDMLLHSEADTFGFTQEDYFAYSKTLDNFSLLVHARGRYTTARNLAERALKFREKQFGKDHPATGASYNNLSVLYKDMGMYSEAEELIEPAVIIQKNTFGEKSIPYAISLNNKALLFQIIGRYDMAKQLMAQSLSIMEDRAKSKHRVIPFKVNLALLHQDLKEYEEAKTIFEDLLELRQSKPRLLQTESDAYLLNHFAALNMEMGNFEEAEKHLQQALKIYKQKLGEKHPSYASVLSNLSHYYHSQNNLAKATSNNEQVLTIRKEILGENHPDYLDAWEHQGVLLWENGNTDEATPIFKDVLAKQLEIAEKLFPSMNEHEKGKYWSKIQPKLMLFYNYAMANHEAYPELLQQMYQTRIKTKGILLSSSLKVKNQILNGDNPQLKEQYIEWLDQKETLANVYSLSKEELKEEGINLDSLEQSTLRAEKALIKSSTAFAEAYQFPQQTLTEVRENLSDNEAAVEIIKVPTFNINFTDTIQYAILIATKTKEQVELVVLKNGNELDTKYSELYKNVVKYKIEDTYSYAQFWGPVEQKLTGIERVFLSLDGIFNQINIATLKKPNGNFVIDDLHTVTVSSTRQIPALKANKSKPTNAKAILFGYPYYGDKGTIDELPGTKEEVEAISTILENYDHDAETYMATEASEHNIKQIKNPKVLHIATHGFFLEDVNQMGSEKVFGVEINKAKENPLLRSGLMLYNAERALENNNSKELQNSDNGILTAYEAMNLSLDQTELVVLSACETGLGEIKSGEGIYGLQRAFQVAGAETIINSLWKVNDETTNKLMVEFYKNWLLSGDKIAAFNKAQLTLKSEHSDPYYWGAFVLVN